MQEPPWEYLADCSESSLQNFEITQLAIADGLLKSIFADIEKPIEARVNANSARMLIEHGPEISRIATLRQQVLQFGDAEPRAIAGKPVRAIRREQKERSA